MGAVEGVYTSAVEGGSTRAPANARVKLLKLIFIFILPCPMGALTLLFATLLSVGMGTPNPTGDEVGVAADAAVCALTPGASGCAAPPTTFK